MKQAELQHRFIPFRKSDLVKMCIQHKSVDVNADDFQQFCAMLSHVFHYEFMESLERLKSAYQSMDPDIDTRTVFPHQDSSTEDFVPQLKRVLNKANYESISMAELNQAMSRSSLFKLRLHVDFEDFSEILLFYRGESKRRQTIKQWFGLRKQEIEFTNYDRVVVYIRYKQDYQPEKGELERGKAGATMLKLFQNVPKADLEMLFPNTALRMRTIDKLMIGVPALVSGGIVVSTKLGATLLLLASLFGFWLGLSKEPVELNAANLTILFAGLGALGGYAWKQFSNIKNRKLSFMQQLTQNLYFKNLDNNAGVFHRLLDEAEEEECKEAILAYFFLLSSNEPMDRPQLDAKIEEWLKQHWQCTMDFEIDDAMAKLIKLGIVQQEPQGSQRYNALPLRHAMAKLDERWDNYFTITLN